MDARVVGVNSSHSRCWDRPLERIASNETSRLTKIISGVVIGILTVLSFGAYAVHAHRYFANRKVVQLPNETVKYRPARPIDPSIKAPPTREEFIAAVRGFKEKHQVKLKDLLVKRAGFGSLELYRYGETYITEDLARLREEFLMDPVINWYLSRDSRFVTFLENRPAFVSDPNNRDESDYYEAKIYKLAEHFFLPYRNEVMEDTFYTDGTVDQLIFGSIKTSSNGPIEVVSTGEDVYRIRDRLRVIESGRFGGEIAEAKKKVQFVLSPNAKDNHATTIVSIIQKGTFRHLASIFINSWKSEEYFDYISYRFNLSGSRGTLLYGDQCDPICSAVKERMGDKTAYIDPERREGYIVNLSQNPSSSCPEIAAVKKALEEKEIDLIHLIEAHKEYKKLYSIMGNRHVPLIDASHNLQTNDEDGNCSLYSLNFLQGIADMLEDEEIANRVYQLAEKMDSGSKPERKEAELALTAIFKEELKRFVPAYYDAEGNPKPYDRIKEYHLYQRWDLGSFGMGLEQLRKNGYLARV